jgi:hypothetical protein
VNGLRQQGLAVQQNHGLEKRQAEFTRHRALFSRGCNSAGQFTGSLAVLAYRLMT